MQTPSFFRYLNEVLGIESVVLPATTPGADLSVEGEGSVMFLGASVLSEPREKDLLLKMIVAMGLDPAQVMIAEGMPTTLQAFESYNLKILILLGTDVSEKLGISVRGEILDKSWKILSTYDPKSLLKNPDLKKHAWNDLKKVIPLLKAPASNA